MSLFHLYAAYAIVPTQELRYTHVAFTLVLSFLLFPLATRFRNRVRWWDVVPGIVAVGDHRLRAVGRRRFHRPRHRARPAGRHRRHRLHRAAAGGDAPHHRADHAGGVAVLHRLCDARPASAGALDASRLRPAAPRRPPLHHAGGHLRRRGRRLGDADHPVHDLRRVPAAIRRRQILHRLLAGADGRQAEQRRPHGRAVVVPARRPVGIGRRHHRDDRHRRLSDDGEGRLREERRRRTARGRRARRDPVAAGARRGRLPDRRVPQDQLSRRDLDGDHPDLPLLPVAADHGRARRQEIRRQGRRRSSRKCRSAR